MEIPTFLTRDPDGAIRLTGHRIGLEHVLFHSKRGWSAQQIADFFPTLTTDLISAVIEFHQSNRDEVNRYLEQVERDLERQKRQAGPGITLQDLKDRMNKPLRETA